MTTTIDMLRLLTWLSPAFPTGSFAYSHGLEWAVEAGDVRDADSLHRWLADIVAHGSGRSDTILLRHAHAAPDDPQLAALAAAAQPSRERQAESGWQGAAFLLAAAPWGAEPGAMPHCVAVGALAGRTGIDVEATASAWLMAFAANLVSAAVRLVPLGQSDGLRVLARLEPLVLDVAAGTKDAPLADIGGACFRADIATMRHETQYTRLFRS